MLDEGPGMGTTWGPGQASTHVHGGCGGFKTPPPRAPVQCLCTGLMIIAFDAGRVTEMTRAKCVAFWWSWVLIHAKDT